MRLVCLYFVVLMNYTVCVEAPCEETHYQRQSEAVIHRNSSHSFSLATCMSIYNELIRLVCVLRISYRP